MQPLTSVFSRQKIFALSSHSLPADSLALQDDDNIRRFLWQLYGEGKNIKWDSFRKMLNDISGEHFTQKMWSKALKALTTTCKTEYKATKDEFKALLIPLGTLFLQVYSIRDELCSRFFGVNLWMRGFKLRKKANDKSFSLETIEKLKLEMTGMARLAKKQKKQKGIPVVHKTAVGCDHTLRPGYSVGQKTLHKAYCGESSLDCQGRIKHFGKQKISARAVEDKQYGDPGQPACGL